MGNVAPQPEIGDEQGQSGRAQIEFGRVDTWLAFNVMGRERIWKLVSTITGWAVCSPGSSRAISMAVRNETALVTPFDPTTPDFSLPDAFLWAAAADIGLAIAKMTSARLTAIGWKAVTGTSPRGRVEELIAA